MSNKKRLGSSPIGLSTVSSNSFRFIPNNNLPDSKQVASKYTGNSSGEPRSQQRKCTEKKIKSYYLEVELIERLEMMANREDTFYSTLVSEAIERWIEIHGY